TAIEESLQRLTRLREVWTRTRADARESHAPSQVIGRIDGVLMAIGSAASQMQAQRASTLVLQDAVARQEATCEVMIDKIATFRRGTAGQLLERTGVAFWTPGSRATGFAALFGRRGDATANETARFRYFGEARGVRAAASAALFVLLALVAFAARRR